MNIETDPGSACNQTFHSFSRFTVSGFKFFRQIILLILLNSCIQNMNKDVQFSGFAAKLLNLMTFFLNQSSTTWVLPDKQLVSNTGFLLSRSISHFRVVYLLRPWRTHSSTSDSHNKEHSCRFILPLSVFFFPCSPQKNQPKIPNRYKRRPGHLPVTTCMLGSAPSPSCTRRVTEEGCVPPLTWVFIALPWSAAGWMSESESRP